MKKSVQRTSDTATDSMIKFVGQLDELKSELIPIDSLVQASLMTTITSLNEDDNYIELDQLTKRFGASFSAALDSLHLEGRALSISSEIQQSLLSKEFQAKLQASLSGIVANTTTDLRASLQDIIQGISLGHLNREIIAMRNAAITNGLSDSLANTLNDVILKMDFDQLRSRFLTEFLNRDFEERIREIVKAPVQDIEDTSTGLLGLIRKYVMYFLAGILAVAAVIIYLVYRFRRRNYQDISVLLMKEIEKGGDTEDIKALKERVKKAAKKRQLEKDIQQTLLTENIET